MWQRQVALRQEVMLQRAAAVEMQEAARRQAELAAQADQSLSEPSHQGRVESDSIDVSIREILNAQQQAWNEGDIDRFMEYYWKSDDLTFSSSGEVTRSWQGTLENYRTRYPSRAEMGQVSFDKLEITPLGPDAALVLGEWQLSRDPDTLGGNFTLIFRRLGDEWLIVHDHTSRKNSD